MSSFVDFTVAGASLPAGPKTIFLKYAASKAPSVCLGVCLLTQPFCSGVTMSPVALEASRSCARRYSSSNCDTLLSVYVITSADACNGGAAAVPAIVPQPPAAAVSNAAPVPVPAIVGGVVGGLAAVAVVFAIVFRRRIIDAVKRWRSKPEEQRNNLDQVVMGETAETSRLSQP